MGTLIATPTFSIVSTTIYTEPRDLDRQDNVNGQTVDLGRDPRKSVPRASDDDDGRRQSLTCPPSHDSLGKKGSVWYLEITAQGFIHARTLPLTAYRTSWRRL